MLTKNKSTFTMNERTEETTRAQREVFKLEQWVGVLDAWSEADLGDGWRVAYRLAIYRGQPVIAELRVFPADEFPGREVATWRAEVVGIEAGSVPSVDGEAKKKVSPYATPIAFPAIRGGITARRLRAVRLGLLMKDTEEVMAKMHAVMKRDLLTWGVEEKKRPTTRRSGAFSDRELARLAGEYVKRCRRSRSPVADIAGQRGLSASRVRDMVHEARSRGLLSAARQGVSGGQVTPLAKRILASLKRA